MKILLLLLSVFPLFMKLRCNKHSPNAFTLHMNSTVADNMHPSQPQKPISQYSRELYTKLSPVQKAVKLYFHLVKKSNWNTIRNLLELCFHLFSSFLILLGGDFVELWALWIKIDSRVFTLQEDELCARRTMTKNTQALISATQAVAQRFFARVEWILVKIHVKSI